MAYDGKAEAQPVTVVGEEDGREPVSDRQSLVTRLAQEAWKYNEEYLQPFREEATKLYQAKPFGNEQEGRSQFIVPETRDKILQIMPAMMRVFTGGERVVRFAGRNAEDDACALQKTDYVNYIFTVDNPGFLLLYRWLKDGFRNRLGVVKSWWQEEEVVERSEHTGLTQEQLLKLIGDPDVDGEESEVTTRAPEADQPAALYDAVIIRKYNKDRVRIANVPGSEFLYSPNAGDLDEDAVLVGQIQDLRRSQLVALGYSLDELAEADSFNSGVVTTEEQDRRVEGPYGDEYGAEEDLDPLIAYGELYIRAPNEDGLAELTKFCTIGTQFEIAREEAVDFHPYSVFCPDPEPHEVQGLSFTDLTGDIGRAKTEAARGMMDSLAVSLDPDLEVDEYNVNMKDVQSSDRPRIIRVKKMGSVREIKYSFASEVLPFMQWLDQVSEARTGSPKASTELSANFLQSTTKEGVAATVSGSQERQELIARIFAETALADLFRKVLRLVIKHQDRSRVVRLRNEYVEVDPRDWDTTMDVRVDVGLGTGVFQDKIQLLAQIAGKQEQILQMLGPGNPLVSLVQYRHTLAKIVEMTGFRDANEFFRPITNEDEQQALAAMAQSKQDKPTSPEELLAQVQAKQIEAEVALRQQEMQLKVQELALKQQQNGEELALKRREIELRDDRERDKAAAEIQLKRMELEMKHQTDIREAELRAEIERERTTTLSAPEPA